jgi:hypothetical protein
MSSTRTNFDPHAHHFVLAGGAVAQLHDRIPACLCGDERDRIISEYRAYAPKGYIPKCSDFTQTSHSTYFTFAELNTTCPSQPAPTYSWALLAEGLLCTTCSDGPNSPFGLDYGRILYGSSRTINSGFRCPSQNAKCGGEPGNQHMCGTAADLQNQSLNTPNELPEWNQMVLAARLANADWIEPITGKCKTHCTHADWRNHPKKYGQF